MALKSAPWCGFELYRSGLKGLILTMFKRDKKDGPVMEWIYIILGVFAIGISFYHWLF